MWHLIWCKDTPPLLFHISHLTLTHLTFDLDVCSGFHSIACTCWCSSVGACECDWLNPSYLLMYRACCVWFNTYSLCVFVCVLYSFGKQLGGRRGCECITLEPSEMIVVSRNTLSVFVSFPITSLFILPPLLPLPFDFIHFIRLHLMSVLDFVLPSALLLFIPFLLFLSSLFFSVSLISGLSVRAPLSLHMLCVLKFIFKWASFGSLGICSNIILLIVAIFQLGGFRK